MCASDLSEALKAFIFANIDSVGKLEVLMLIAGSPGREWTHIEVTKELRGSEAATIKYLAELRKAGVLTCDDSQPVSRYHFAPQTPELLQVVEELLAAHHTFSARIIHLIYNKSIEQIREFAQAFRIRKDSDDS